MKGILKSPVLCSRHPQRHKTVSFPAGTALCTNVHEADEWDRSPVAATRKLTYQDILELKEMQIALLKNTPAFPQLLSTVPVGLVPLLPPDQPQKLDKVPSTIFEKVDEVGRSQSPSSPESLAQEQLCELSPSDRAPSPPITVPVQSQSVTPTRKFYLPIVPLQDVTSSLSRATRTSPPIPTSPNRASSPASSFSSSPPFTSPLSGRSSPFGRSCSPSSSSGTYSSASGYRSPMPPLPSQVMQRNPEAIGLSNPKPTGTDYYIPQLTPANSTFSSSNFPLLPSFLGIYGTHNTFRDILRPNPSFPPYSLATRPTIYSNRIKSSTSQTWRIDN